MDKILVYDMLLPKKTLSNRESNVESTITKIVMIMERTGLVGISVKNPSPV